MRNSAVLLVLLSQAGFAKPGEQKPIETLGRLPVGFEENRGQWDSRVRFGARGAGYALLLAPREVRLMLAAANPQRPQHARTAAVRMKFLSSTGSRLEAREPLPGVSNYFMGNDRSRWRSGIRHYTRIAYQDLYPGISAIFYGRQRQFEYDLEIAPGVDPSRVRIGFEGIRAMRIAPGGDLILSTVAGQIRQRKPAIYQQSGGRRVPIRGEYVMLGPRQAGFRVGAYDDSQPLVIDPVLVYATYLGGSSEDQARGIAVDSEGSIFITGSTYSLDFPSVNPAGSRSIYMSTFVIKMNASGTALLYSTFLGGAGGENSYTSPGTQVSGIAVDRSGNAYIAGYTTSPLFPVIRAAQPLLAGLADAFITKLNPEGALVYSTFLGGARDEEASGIAVDPTGSAYVAGWTMSDDFPTANARQAGRNSVPDYQTDGFVTKVDPSGLYWTYSTYHGGSAPDTASVITADTQGNAYVAGSTDSFDFPLLNAVQPGFGGYRDVFVSKFSPAGALRYSTYLGGSDMDVPTGIAVDGSGSAYVTGSTASVNFPTVSPLAQQGHAFISKINAGGSALVYSTYLAGQAIQTTRGIAVDSLGRAYVVGTNIYPGGFSTVQPLPGNPYGGGGDVFVSLLNAEGANLDYSVLVGGSHGDDGNAIAVDSTGNAYVAGTTGSPDFPVSSNAFQSTTTGAYWDAVVLKISPAEALRFVPFVPCRVADTRDSTGKAGFSGARDFPVAGLCGVPADARAYSFNVSAVPRAASLGFLAIWPAGQDQPVVSTLNSYDGRVKANAALVPAGANGAVSVYVSDPADVFLDINGYFVPAGSAPAAPVYYPVTSCRVMDTRADTGKAGFSGTRNISMTGVCGLPPGAQAYAVNFTVLPRTASFSFMTAWPTGQAQPGVSTLNAFTGAVTANAAIVPAGADGSINVYHTDAADLLVDVTGYFAPPGAGGLSFYTTTPCRVVDTRTDTNKLGFAGTRAISMPGAACGLPLANVYSLNATAIPRPQLDFLTLWPTDGAQPGVSTLNSFDGSVVSNAALVPATSGSISAYHTQAADLFLDVNGYFAP